jgi:hypothetical protein
MMIDVVACTAPVLLPPALRRILESGIIPLKDFGRLLVILTRKLVGDELPLFPVVKEVGVGVIIHD